MKTLLTAATIFCTIAIALGDCDVAREFRAAKLTPNVVRDAPTALIEVTYGAKKVNLGNEFTPLEVALAPAINYEYEEDALYTLAMIDPDAPTLGSNRQILHLLIGNIPENRVSEGDLLAFYLSPTPIPLTGKHRYTFVLYKQDQGFINFDEDGLVERLVTQRLSFSINQFAEQYDLEGPVAGNFFRAQILGSLNL